MGVYKKGKRWFIDYYLPDGKRKREVVTIEGIDPSRITRLDALNALSIRKAQNAQGKFEIEKTKKPLPFVKLLKRYLEWANTNHKAYWRDEQIAKVLLQFFNGKFLTQIKSWDIERYKKERKAQGRKPETINRELTVLKRLFNLGMQWGLTSSNPVKGVKFMTAPKRPYQTLDDNEFERIYRASSPEFKTVLLCYFLTGMRRDELRNLKWEDVDLESGHIFVKETKNNESRNIPMEDFLKEKLLELKKDKGEYVFQTFKDKSVTAFYRELWKASERSGIKCTFHTFRHTFTSNLMTRLKEDPATVMELTGHKDVRMLMRYAHTKEELKKAAIAKLGTNLKLFDMDTYLDTSTGKISKIVSE